MENIIIMAILISITGGSIRYLIRAKQRGETCIGCPCSKQCDNHCKKDFSGKFDNGK